MEVYFDGYCMVIADGDDRIRFDKDVAGDLIEAIRLAIESAPDIDTDVPF